MRAMSVSAAILFTASEAESLSNCRVAVRSFQNGIFTSRPPELLDRRRLYGNRDGLAALRRIDDAYHVGGRRSHRARCKIANAVYVDSLHWNLPSAGAHLIHVQHRGNPH